MTNKALILILLSATVAHAGATYRQKVRKFEIRQGRIVTFDHPVAWGLGGLSSLDEGAVLFVDPNGFITSDVDNFFYNDSTKLLSVQDLAITAVTDGGLLLGSGAGAITALGVAANGQIPIGDGATDPVLATITGTANQVNIANGAGSITLSLDQDFDTGATPTLAGLTLSGITDTHVLYSNATVLAGDASLTWDDGAAKALTIAGASVMGLNSVVFQPAADSTTFFQVLDQDGGTPILNIDSTNERVGVRTNAPLQIIDCRGNIAAFGDENAGGSTISQVLVGNWGSGQGTMNFQYRNATAIGSPRGVYSFQPRNNADSTTIEMAQINVEKKAGEDSARMDLLTKRAGSGAVESRIQITNTEGDISFNSGQQYFDRSTGRVGIGVTTPEARLEIVETSQMTGAAAGVPAIFIPRYDSPTSQRAALTIIQGSAASVLGATGTIFHTRNRPFGFSTENKEIDQVLTTTPALFIAAENGNVGIGTVSPDTKLQVVGDCKFGDDNTNYASFSSTGALSFTGSPGITVGSTVAIGLDMSGGTFATAIQKWPAGTIQSTGAITFQPTVDTTTAYRWLDSSGNTMLAIDTSTGDGIASWFGAPITGIDISLLRTHSSAAEIQVGGDFFITQDTASAFPIIALRSAAQSTHSSGTIASLVGYQSLTQAKSSSAVTTITAMNGAVSVLDGETPAITVMTGVVGGVLAVEDATVTFGFGVSAPAGTKDTGSVAIIIGGIFAEQTIGTNQNLSVFMGGDSAIASDKKFNFEGVLGANGDTYMVYDSAGTTLDCFVNGTEVWNASATAFISVIGRVINRTSVTSSPYTVLATDHHISVTTASTAITLNLPAIVDGTIYHVKDQDGNAAGKNITVSPNGAETIETAANLVINTNFASVTLVANSATSNWEIQ